MAILTHVLCAGYRLRFNTELNLVPCIDVRAAFLDTRDPCSLLDSAPRSTGLLSPMRKTSSDGWNWFWRRSAGVCGKRIAEQVRKSLRWLMARPRPGKKLKKISYTASSEESRKSKSRISGRKPVRSRWRDVRPWGQSRIRCSCDHRPSSCALRSKPKSGTGTGCDLPIPPVRRIDSRREFPR